MEDRGRRHHQSQGEEWANSLNKDPCTSDYMLILSTVHNSVIFTSSIQNITDLRNISDNFVRKEGTPSNEKRHPI